MPIHYFEEDFEDQKAARKERKRLSGKDRSKYKKTDREKRQQRARQRMEKFEKQMRGRVLSITSQGIFVDHEGETVVCTLRGVLKKEKTRRKNLVTVGDFVLFDKIDEEEGVIEFIEPRTSLLSRADAVSRRKEQLIAANIDQVLITTSIVTPPLIPALVDRYIIATKKGNMVPVVILNKIDLMDDDEKKLVQEFLEAYDKAKIPVIQMSAKTEEGLDQLRKVMKDKASVFSGQSGAGKSSLINAITGLELPVGKTVRKTRKGAHTTSTAHLVRLDFGGWCIDTPGIKSFGLWDLKIDEIETYFTEIHEQGVHCKFLDCTHTHENQCAVIDAVKNGDISQLRYDSYESLLVEAKKNHLRR